MRGSDATTAMSCHRIGLLELSILAPLQVAMRSFKVAAAVAVILLVCVSKEASDASFVEDWGMVGEAKVRLFTL